MSEKPIGYLDKGKFLCFDCAVKHDINDIMTPVYLVNIKPYSQTCSQCGCLVIDGLKKAIGDNQPLELFEGRHEKNYIKRQGSPLEVKVLRELEKDRNVTKNRVFAEAYGNLRVIDFIPDASYTWTKEEAEYYLSNFIFNGPGWYKRNDTHILAIPLNRIPEVFWVSGAAQGERFKFCVYSGRNPTHVFNLIADAPECK